jgi:hypothetical protein
MAMIAIKLDDSAELPLEGVDELVGVGELVGNNFSEAADEDGLESGEADVDTEFSGTVTVTSTVATEIETASERLISRTALGIVVLYMLIL